MTLLAASLVIRAMLVGRGPWGNMYEFTVAFGVGILAGLSNLERRYPDPSDRVPSGRGRDLALALLGDLPHEIRPLMPALQNAPLLTIHVGMAIISYGIFATRFAAGVGYLIQGRPTGIPGCQRTGRSTRWRIAPSSSASRSSPR